MEKDSLSGVSLRQIWRSLSLGTTMSASTHLRSLAIPSSAYRILLAPSNIKGLVTTATVRMPISFAVWAIIGMAPVPVPPPMPAVRYTMSEPLRYSLISASDSFAACSPIWGRAPAPNPFVTLSPRTILFWLRDMSRLLMSVLTARISTPSIPLLIMWLRAFPPPPPTAMTFMDSLRAGSDLFCAEGALVFDVPSDSSGYG